MGKSILTSFLKVSLFMFSLTFKLPTAVTCRHIEVFAGKTLPPVLCHCTVLDDRLCMHYACKRLQCPGGKCLGCFSIANIGQELNICHTKDWSMHVVVSVCILHADCLRLAMLMSAVLMLSI